MGWVTASSARAWRPGGQADFLREAGCEEAQCFYFARPLPLEEYEALVYPEG